MHAGNAQMMNMAGSFWPFAYSLKSYDMALHPAFLPSAYRILPSNQFPAAAPHAHTNGNVHSPVHTPKSTDKFSIDAILNRDKTSDRDNTTPSPKDLQKTYSDYRLSDRLTDRLTDKECEDLSRRRQQRFLEASHPYLGHHTTAGLSEKSYLQKHLPTSYKQFTETNRQDKSEKKSSPIGDSWSKPSKGKRVRTIFTPEQLERMEAEFERQQYMVGTERYYLANSLNLTEAQVKVWFQNRRIKWRKQHLEQQQAKLKQMDIYRNAADSASDDESDDDMTRDPESHMESLADPFQSPKEIRCTQ